MVSRLIVLIISFMCVNTKSLCSISETKIILCINCISVYFFFKVMIESFRKQTVSTKKQRNQNNFHEALQSGVEWG